jgi:hypothetical protein
MSENDASMIIIDDSRVMLQILASLMDNSGGIIYDRNEFIGQATDLLKVLNGSEILKREYCKTF